MKRHILLCVVGTTPQIITETIYALCQKNIYINELIVITTSAGAKEIKNSLIDRGILEELIKDYKLPPIGFSPQKIHIIKSHDNSELSDIRTTLDNESAGDFICRIVSELTCDDNSILHCSIAGGRKTMGFYLGIALQLYGRKDDKLYHVLVNEEFENNPKFFYPPPKPKTFVKSLPDGKKMKVTTDKAKVELAELPFIRLRTFIDFQNKSLKDLIPVTQNEIDAVKRLQPLTFLTRSKEVKVGSREIKLSPSLWKFYFQFAKIKKEMCPDRSRAICGDCHDCFLPMKTDQQNKKGICTLLNLDESNIRTLMSKLNRALKQQIPFSYTAPYLITSYGQHHGKSYGLLIDKLKIIFLEE